MPEEIKTPEANEPEVTTPAPEPSAEEDDWAGKDNDFFEAEVDKRGAKNIMLENRKKAKRIKELEEQVAKPKSEQPKPSKENTPGKETEVPAPKPKAPGVKLSPKYVKEYREKMSARGIDKDEIEDNIKFMGQMAYSMSKQMVAPAKKYALKETRKETLDRLQENPKYKYPMTKLRPDLEKILDKVDPDYWEDEKYIASHLGQLILEKSEEIFGSGGQPNRTVEAISESSRTEKPGSSIKGGVTDTEAKAFARKNGMGFDTPEEKEEVYLAIKSTKKDK